MGRVKLEIKKIENKANRLVTYNKRRNGLLKKAHELSVLCDVDIGVITFSESGAPSVYCSKDKMIEDLVIRYGDISLGEGTRLAANYTEDNIELGLQAPIVGCNDLQQENQQLKARLVMMNQEMESWKRHARLARCISTSCHGGQLLDIMQEFQEEHTEQQVGSFGMDMSSRPVFENSNQDLANMPSTSQKRELFQEDFQNHQELLSSKPLMSSLHYGNPTDFTGDQGAQTPGYNSETMQIGHGSVSQNASQNATVTIAQPR